MKSPIILYQVTVLQNRSLTGARARTIKCGEVGCPEFEPGPCINYATSLPTELTSRGQKMCIIYTVHKHVLF